MRKLLPLSLPTKASKLSLVVACSLAAGTARGAETPEVGSADAALIAPATLEPATETPIATEAAAPVAQEPIVAAISPRETIDERFPNGTIKIRREVSQDAEGNYRNDGEWTLYDERGRILIAGSYKDGLRHGMWEKAYAKGEGSLFSGAITLGFSQPLISTAMFENGQLHGTWTIVDANDRKVCEWEFDQGVRHGKSIWYYPTGKKFREAIYSAGQLDGNVQEWSADGKQASDQKYVHGSKLVKVEESYSAGKRKVLGTQYVPQGTFEGYDWATGTAQAVPAAKSAPVKEGKWTYWHANGQEAMRGTYENDQPIGKFSWFYATGQKQLEGTFDAGQRTGKFVWWHANGQKQMEAGYIAGVLDGKWSSWTKEGKIVEKGEYMGESQAIPTPIEEQSSESTADRTNEDSARKLQR